MLYLDWNYETCWEYCVAILLKISQTSIITRVIMIISRYELISRIFITFISNYVEFHDIWSHAPAVISEKHDFETVPSRLQLVHYAKEFEFFLYTVSQKKKLSLPEGLSLIHISEPTRPY